MQSADDLWMGSVREYHARRRQQATAAWIAYHTNQAERHRRALQALVDHHEEQAERLNAELASHARGREGKGTWSLSSGHPDRERAMEERALQGDTESP